MTFEVPDFLSDNEIRDKAASDNIIQTFQLEESQIRGRAVRLGSILNDILEPHAYPEPVAHLVAETITLALLLSSMLKYDGIFTLQTKGNGPVNMLVADVTSEGHVRGCASFDPVRFEHAQAQLSALEAKESSQNHLAQYLGKGYIAFTVDPKDTSDRYQGIVELKGASLVDCVQHYFAQSEQIGTGIKMAVGKRGKAWRAGGIMLQHMPEEGKNPEAGGSNTREDDWRRSMILLDTSSEHEMLDPSLPTNDLLFRLFHEEGVRVYNPEPLIAKCRCNEERIENMLFTMPEDDLDHMAIRGKIEVKCEFCSHEYIFDLKTVKGKMTLKS